MVFCLKLFLWPHLYIINYVETYKFTIANTNMYKHKNKRTQNLYWYTEQTYKIVHLEYLVKYFRLFWNN